MKCDEVNAVLSAYIDGELSSVQTQQVNEHIQSCADCSKDYRALIQLGNTIKSSNIYASAPAHLKKQLSDKLRENENRTLYWPGIPARFAYSLPALLLGLIIGWAAMSQFKPRDSEDELLQSLASAHIHSLMANHLTDVASSDSHTVKPWFHGRLDFSPPVHDFTQQGYPLIGGRLEYLAENPAAALVYRHSQHTINLFIQPEPAQTSSIKPAVYNGYQIINWNDESFSYSAISDLNLSDLKRFRALLNNKTSRKPEAAKD